MIANWEWERERLRERLGKGVDDERALLGAVVKADELLKALRDSEETKTDGSGHTRLSYHEGVFIGIFFASEMDVSLLLMDMALEEAEKGQEENSAEENGSEKDAAREKVARANAAEEYGAEENVGGEP